MSLELAPELQDLFGITTGIVWPQLNEDRLFFSAADWDGYARELEGIADEVAQTVHKLKTIWTGHAADAFVAAGGVAVADLRSVRGNADQLAGFLREIATEVQYTKRMIIGQLVILAVMIAEAIAIAASTSFLGATAWLAGYIEGLIRLGQQFAIRVMARLVDGIFSKAIASGIEASVVRGVLARVTADVLLQTGSQAGLSWAVQQSQISDGTRDHLDPARIGDAARTAAVGVGIAHAGGAALQQVRGMAGRAVAGASETFASTDRVGAASLAARVRGGLTEAAWGVGSGAAIGALTAAIQGPKGGTSTGGQAQDSELAAAAGGIGGFIGGIGHGVRTHLPNAPRLTAIAVSPIEHIGGSAAAEVSLAPASADQPVAAMAEPDPMQIRPAITPYVIDETAPAPDVSSPDNSGQPRGPRALARSAVEPGAHPLSDAGPTPTPTPASRDGASRGLLPESGPPAAPLVRSFAPDVRPVEAPKAADAAAIKAALNPNVGSVLGPTISATTADDHHVRAGWSADELDRARRDAAHMLSDNGPDTPIASHGRDWAKRSPIASAAAESTRSPGPLEPAASAVKAVAHRIGQLGPVANFMFLAKLGHDAFVHGVLDRPFPPSKDEVPTVLCPLDNPPRDVEMHTYRSGESIFRPQADIEPTWTRSGLALLPPGHRGLPAAEARPPARDSYAVALHLEHGRPVVTHGPQRGEPLDAATVADLILSGAAATGGLDGPTPPARWNERRVIYLVDQPDSPEAITEWHAWRSQLEQILWPFASHDGLPDFNQTWLPVIVTEALRTATDNQPSTNRVSPPPWWWARAARWITLRVHRHAEYLEPAELQALADHYAHQLLTLPRSATASDR
jgi:hypothetical protein